MTTMVKSELEGVKTGPEQQKDFLVYRAPIVRRVIPTLAKEEDALNFVKLVKRKSSKRLKIQTEDLTNVQEKSEVHKFKTFPLLENSITNNSNSLERIRELQRKDRYAHQMGGGFGGSDD